MSPEPMDIQTAIDRARTIERQERDAQMGDQFDQVERIGQALQARRDPTSSGPG